MLETDTRATRDGLARRAHEDCPYRRRPRRIDEFPMDAGAAAARRPAARDARGRAGRLPDVLLNIDVKSSPRSVPPSPRRLTRSADRVCLAGFDGAVVRRAVATLRAATGVTAVRSPSRGVIGRFLAARALEAPLAVTDRLLAPYGALQVPETYKGIPVVTRDTVAAAHHAGCEVHVWTVDDPVTMQDLLVKGVDGIITNRVDLLSELLDDA